MKIADVTGRLEVLSERLSLFELLRQRGLMTDTDAERYLEDLREVEKLRRIERGYQDVLYFVYEYFSDDRNPGNDDNLIPVGTLGTAPEFHRELTRMLDSVTMEKRNARIAYACPRGHGKSAYLSNAFPVHQLVYELRHYILIISETDAMSNKFVEWVSGQLKFNKKLREDFGELLHEKKALNERDNQEAFLTLTGALVESSSMGKQMRGKRNGAYRPDLVICDDLESVKNTNTADLRDKNLHWFNSVVLPIGNPRDTAFVYMGTYVNGNGLLPTIIRRGDFQSRVYSAVVSHPDREDLWQEFESLYRDMERGEQRYNDAMEFYDANKVEMDAGVEVLWPQRWSYSELMLEKVNMGSRAFGSEYLNNPIDEETQIFKPDNFLFYDVGDIKDAHGNTMRLEYFGFWDIAMGKSKRSDYNAIITLGRDKRTGIIYVIEAWAAQCPAHVALERALSFCREYPYKVFGVETVQAQFDLYRQLREKAAAAGIYGMKFKPVQPRTKKETRIEMLEPMIENGVLRFRRTQRLLIEQLEQYPNGDHDDLPDALSGACDLCKGAVRRSYYRKPEGV